MGVKKEADIAHLWSPPPVQCSFLWKQMSPGKYVLAPRAEGEKLRWTCSKEPLPVGAEAGSLQRGDTKFFLCSQLISFFCQDIAVDVPNSLLSRPHLGVASWPLSPEKWEGLPRFPQQSAAEPALPISSLPDLWSSYSVMSGWRWNSKEVL